MQLMDTTGRLRKLEHLSKVTLLETLKTEHGSNPWPVIEKCVEVWKSTSPTQWNSHLIHIEDVRSTRRNTKYAWNSRHGDSAHGGILRYTLDIPEKVMLMIRCLYNSDELPMNKAFYHEFAKRFPTMKIAEST